MCCCDQPTVNGQPGYKWQPDDKPGIRPVCPPALDEHDKLLYDEPGRCGGDSPDRRPGSRNGCDAHCHHYRLVRHFGSVELLVRHGGGDERFRVSHTWSLLNTLAALDSDSRYWVLHAIYHAHSDGARAAAEKTDMAWRQAAADKRIKTRKRRGTDSVKVWIEPKQTVQL